MKKLLLLICLLPGFTFAQDFKLAVGGGYIPSSSGIPNTFKPTAGDKEMTPGLVTMIRAGFTSGMFDFGAGFEYGSFRRKGKLMYSDPEVYKDLFEVWHAGTFCLPYGYCNIRFRLTKKMTGYGGAMIGALLPDFRRSEMNIMMNPTEELPYNPKMTPELKLLDHPVVLGMQAGVNVGLSKNISFYTELGLRTFQTFAEMNYPYPPKQVNYRLWYFPVTAGLTFNLFHANFSKKPVKW